MLAFIKGSVIETNIEQRWAIVDTGSLGYNVFAPPQALKNCGDETVLFWTHVVYSEHDQKIFGFIEKIELIIFRHLIQVNGIGPKTALEVLATFPKNQFINLMFENDDDAVKSIIKTKGVGKKTAQTIFISVREQLMMLSDQNPSQKQPQNDTISNVVLQALYNLGYSHRDIINDCSWYDNSASNEQNIKNFFQNS